MVNLAMEALCFDTFLLAEKVSTPAARLLEKVYALLCACGEG